MTEKISERVSNAQAVLLASTLLTPCFPDIRMVFEVWLSGNRYRFLDDIGPRLR